MNFFDLISDSPKLFIFQKEANKTNFGGVLFMIYIITMLLISLAYILDYALNDKYTYESVTSYNHTDDKEEIKKMNDDIKLNPYINFIAHFKDDNFSLVFKSGKGEDEEEEEAPIKENGKTIYKYKLKADEIVLVVVFVCREKNCSSFDDYFKSHKYDNFGYISIEYPGFKINHFGNPPIYDDKPKSYYKNFYLDNIDSAVGYHFNWEIIKYQDQKSLFDTFTKRQTEYIYGHIKNDKPDIETIYDIRKINDLECGEHDYYLPLYGIIFKNPHDEYLLYKRKKIEILDVLASIGALFSTLRTCVIIIFSFYSKNFNNYKIISKLLTTPKEPIKKVELSADFKEISLNNKEEENKNKPLIEYTSNENKNNTKNYDINEDTIKDNSSFALDKLHFYDYFLNNVYSQCCKKRRNQELINMTNNIVYKYFSVDLLLYNQIIMENLLKDYKWNNPMLNNVQNNPMIIKLKNI